eukprot:48528-Chlamydomonas_euryale.AAC.2
MIFGGGVLPYPHNVPPASRPLTPCHASTHPAHLIRRHGTASLTWCCATPAPLARLPPPVHRSMNRWRRAPQSTEAAKEPLHTCSRVGQGSRQRRMGGTGVHASTPASAQFCDPDLILGATWT